MPQDLPDDKSTLVQVMAWCRQATSHYLNQCWPRSPTPYRVNRPQWVKLVILLFLHLMKQVTFYCLTACNLFSLNQSNYTRFKIRGKMVIRHLCSRKFLCQILYHNKNRALLKHFVQSSWFPSIKSSVTSSKADDRKSRYQITGLTFSEPNLYISNMTNGVHLMSDTNLSCCDIFLWNTVNSCCNRGHYSTSLHTIWQRIEIRFTAQNISHILHGWLYWWRNAYEVWPHC